MSLSAKTSNYNIPMAELTDKYSATDINQIAEKVDEVIKAIDDSIVTKTSTLVNRIDNIETNVTDKIDNIETNVTDKIDNIKDDLGDFIGVSTTLTNRVDNIETTVTNNTNSITNFLNRLNTIQAEINQLKNDIAGSGVDLTNYAKLAPNTDVGNRNHEKIIFDLAGDKQCSTTSAQTSHITLIDNGNQTVNNGAKTAPAISFVANTIEGYGDYTAQVYADRNRRRLMCRVYDYSANTSIVHNESIFDEKMGETRSVAVKTEDIAFLSDIPQSTGGAGAMWMPLGLISATSGASVHQDFTNISGSMFIVIIFMRSASFPSYFKVRKKATDIEVEAMIGNSVPVIITHNDKILHVKHNGPSNVNITGNPVNYMYCFYMEMPHN